MLRFKTLFGHLSPAFLLRHNPILTSSCCSALLKVSFREPSGFMSSTTDIARQFASYNSRRSDQKIVPKSLPSFKPYNLSEPMEEAIAAMDILAPTPIQELVLQEWNKHKRHIVFAAQTGTGKTLAYAIPLIDSLKAKENKSKTVLTLPKRPRAVIFVPNKELVTQTLEVIKEICHHIKLKSIGLSGTDPYTREKASLEEGVDILVATIDRFEKHHQKQNVFLSQAEYIIIDELDTFLDASYADNINNYIQVGIKLATKPKMVFLSSTFTEKMKQMFISNFGKDQASFTIILDKNTHYNLSNLEHEFLHLPSLDKQNPLLDVLKQYKKYIEKTQGGTIIFCNSVPSCQSVDYFLKENGYDCVTLHGDVPKKLRIQNFDRFRRREVHILISTDLGSRGLDFPWVNHIINFDFPKTASDYLHRAGRAGRAGRKGYVSSLYHKKDFQLIEELQSSNDEGRPLHIKGSAFETKAKNVNEKPKSDDGLNRISNDKALAKFLPADYVQFRKQYDESVKKNEGRVRGYKRGKDAERTEIKELKRKMKMPKSLRTKNSRFVQKIKKRLRGVNRKIQAKKAERTGQPIPGKQSRSKK